MSNSTEYINGVGFNTEYIKKATLEQFIDRHKHLWPTKDSNAVESDLRRIYYLHNSDAPRNLKALGKGNDD